MGGFGGVTSMVPPMPCTNGFDASVDPNVHATSVNTARVSNKDEAQEDVEEKDEDEG